MLLGMLEDEREPVAILEERGRRLVVFASDHLEVNRAARRSVTLLQKLRMFTDGNGRSMSPCTMGIGTLGAASPLS